MRQIADLESYLLKEERYVEELHSKGYILEHKKTGARIFLLSNDDENKVFCIGFRTPPSDSTGVAHILEHSVLEGSEKFPVKDPFVELVKGSLNTFLNAMTYPDKTVYPVASCNEKDFQNLMDVYMDAVLHPNIYKEEKIFRQEGWHYEMESEDSPVTLNGVVYNEMKGAFSSPESLRVEMELPHRGRITGMGIKEGITLIVGGGYHGKSTLLKALELGVYNHVAGDGREYVITDDTALKLRAEDGRSINNVDISLFINDLPNKKDTRRFSTPDASGSTSQAAGVIEGWEAGSRVFLIDEDTSATNFMLRDELMQHIISRDKEPITPFIERARDLFVKAGISTVLVAGSSGAYFYIADTIIQMDCYVPLDITEKTKKACAEYGEDPTKAAPGFSLPAPGRKLAVATAGKSMASSAGRQSAESRGGYGNSGRGSYGDSGRGGYGDNNRGGYGRDSGRGGDRGGRGRDERIKTKTYGKDSLQVGKEQVDLRFVEQLIHGEQTAALAQMVRYCLEKQLFPRYSITEIVKLLTSEINRGGLPAISDSSYAAMGLCMPREQEIFACLNRYRG